MCLIIDANIAHCFARPIRPEAAAVLHWIEAKAGCIVYGGLLATELANAGADVKSLIINLSRAGRAKRVNDSLVLSETEVVMALGECCSDDPHIIALARLSGARVLFSRDINLHVDFKNARLVDNPRGQVYQNEAHTRLLKHTATCIGRPPTGTADRAKRRM